MPSNNAQDFKTHYNYVKCMNGMMHEISIVLPLSPKIQYEAHNVERFLKLATLTKDGIQAEIQACIDEPVYAEIVAPWLPVKHYYRLYYLEAVLIHLAQGTSKVFLDGGHRTVRNMVTSFCGSGYVTSKFNEAQKVVTLQDAISHTIKAGQNISPTYYLTQPCIKSVRAKIASYVLDHWKLNKQWTRYSTAAKRAERDHYKSVKTICLLDFFYQMRLKANYKDLNFLRFNEVTPDELLDYTRMFHSAAMKYGACLEEAIRDTAQKRGIILGGS